MISLRAFGDGLEDHKVRLSNAIEEAASNSPRADRSATSASQSWGESSDNLHPVQLQLKRGESRHGLARWMFFANRGEFRTGDYEEIMNKASCLSLLSNAMLVWNTLAITKIVTLLRGAGETIADEDLARISPLMHQHVIPNGTYHFARRKQGDDIS
jgi:Tn3 transposase DDE domain